MAKRRIMRRFVLNEISAVDRPAQEHARAVILKRGDVDPRDKYLRVTADADMSQDPRERRRRKYLSVTDEDSDMSEPQDFESAVAKLRRGDVTLKSNQARTLARQKYPHLVEKMQREADAKVAQSQRRPVQKSNSNIVDFMDRVAKYQRETGCSRTQAMTAVRTQNPAAFAKLQEV